MERRNAIAFIVLSAILLGCGRDELPLSEECLEFWQVKEGLFASSDLRCQDDCRGTEQRLFGSYGGDSHVWIQTCLCTNETEALERLRCMMACSSCPIYLIQPIEETNVVGQLLISCFKGSLRGFSRNNVFVSVRTGNHDLTLELCQKIDDYILECLRRQRERNRRERPVERYWRRGFELQQMTSVKPDALSLTGAKWRMPQMFKTSGGLCRDGQWNGMVVYVRPARERGWFDFYEKGGKIARCRVREFSNRHEARDWMFAEVARAELPLHVLAGRVRVESHMRSNGDKGRIPCELLCPRCEWLADGYYNYLNVVAELHAEPTVTLDISTILEAFWNRCLEIADRPEDGIGTETSASTQKVPVPHRMSEINRRIPELQLSRVFGIDNELVERIIGSAKMGSWVKFAFKLDTPYGPFEIAEVELGVWHGEEGLKLRRLTLLRQFDAGMSTAELQKAYRKVVQMVGDSLGCDLPVPEFDPETPSMDKLYMDPNVMLMLNLGNGSGRMFIKGKTPQYVLRKDKWMLSGKPTISIECEFARSTVVYPKLDGRPIVPKAFSFGHDESASFSAALRDKMAVRLGSGGIPTIRPRNAGNAGHAEAGAVK